MTDSGTEDGEEENARNRTSGFIKVPNVIEYDASSENVVNGKS